jgi:4-deoxy-L-threo-5-hexosulose-uronate ketol-isomerase
LAFHMATRYAHSPEDIKHFDTTKLRQEFLMEKIFNAGDILLTYTYNDRMIFGGVVPTESSLEIKLSKELGVDFFLQRRELGVINIGGPGSIIVDGDKAAMVKQDGYYIGMGTKQVVFASDNPANPAKSMLYPRRPTKLILTKSCHLQMRLPSQWVINNI